MKAPRVCFVSTYYAPDNYGGAERSLRLLAEQAAALGHEPTVICLGRTRSSEHLDGVAIERVPPRNLYHPLDAAKQSAARKLIWHTRDAANHAMGREVATLLDKIRPDVLHTNNLAGFSSAVWAAAAARGIPIAHTLRDYYLLCPSTTMFKNGATCARRCTSCRVLSWPRGRATSLVQCAIGVSDFILQKHLQAGCFPNAQSRVVANGYRNDSPPQEPPEGVLRFGYIGRIAPSKGLVRLLEAFRELTQHGSQAELLIAGTGEDSYMRELRALAAGSPVRFAGHMEPRDFFREVHYTVIPSEWEEPFGRVVIESFAHAVPVLSSSTGGLTELVRERENGFLFAASGSTDLLRCLREAENVRRSDAYLQMRRQSLEAARLLTPEQIAAQYSETYYALADRQQRSRNDTGAPARAGLSGGDVRCN